MDTKEVIYKGNFVDSLSLIPGRKYIISNNALNNENYFVFISSNKDFNLNDIGYNTINSLDNLDKTEPIRDGKEVDDFVNKRIYATINNSDNKAFIGFKTGKIAFPFKMIKQCI